MTSFDKVQPEDNSACEAYEAGDWSSVEPVTVQTVFGPITYVPRRDERAFTIDDERAFKDCLFGLNSNAR